MAIPPITNRLEIRTVESGFYRGFNPTVSLVSKIIVTLLVLALVANPTAAAAHLQVLKDLTLTLFAAWYINLLGVFVVACVVLVLLPGSGRMKLGKPTDVPEYSTISWLSIMVFAGIGTGILAFCVSEPVSHSTVNPEILAGDGESGSIPSVLRYTYLHWGVSAWSCYAIVALALALNCHRNGQPMTMRSALVPLFGPRLEGWLGDLVDILSILAMIAGATTTIVVGLEQICSGLFILTGNPFFADLAGDPPLMAILTALTVALSIAVTSIVSGVDRGVKWVSNLGLVVAIGVLLVFMITGPFWRLLGGFAEGSVVYLRQLPTEIFTVYDPSAGPAAAQQSQWQLDWTVFYWAWWIAFTPGVGLFLARISRGRTAREFILGAVLAPTLMCFFWFSILGGSALPLEADGIAQGQIVNAPHAFRIFEMVELSLAPRLASLMKWVLVFLFLILVVASASAAIIAIKSIGTSGTTVSEAPHHSMVWVLVIGGITGAVMAVGGMTSVRDVMIMGAVPFSAMMSLMLVSIFILVVRAFAQTGPASVKPKLRT